MEDVLESVAYEELIVEQLRRLAVKLCWNELFNREMLSAGFSVDFSALKSLEASTFRRLRKALRGMYGEVGLDDFTRELEVLEGEVAEVSLTESNFPAILNEKAKKLKNIAPIVSALIESVKMEGERLDG